MIIVENEEDFKFYTEIQALKSCLGKSTENIIRLYMIKDMTIEEAEKAWYNGKITFVELNYIIGY